MLKPLTEISWPITLETERLVLRSLEPSDYQACHNALDGQLPKQHQYDYGHVDLGELDANWFADACKLHRESALIDYCYNWVVFHKQTHQHLGTIDLSTIKRDVFQWANLGYVIHNQFWRQGFGKEAVTAAVKAGFEHLHYHRIEAAINLDNHASIALVESVGLQRECIRRAYWYENEQWVDHLIYVALPGDFGVSEKPPSVSVEN
jgi:ribosomal-protein-alanine N-acetyltransferase